MAQRWKFCFRIESSHPGLLCIKHLFRLIRTSAAAGETKRADPISIPLFSTHLHNTNRKAENAKNSNIIIFSICIMEIASRADSKTQLSASLFSHFLLRDHYITRRELCVRWLAADGQFVCRIAGIYHQHTAREIREKEHHAGRLPTHGTNLSQLDGRTLWLWLFTSRLLCWHISASIDENETRTQSAIGSHSL